MTKVSEVPDLMRIWDEKRNTEDPTSLSAGSHKKVWWKCTNANHSWDAEVKTVNKGSRCKYCYGKKVLPGYNDMATLRPDLLEIWDYQKNTASPTDIAPNANRDKRHWLCKKYGHEWSATPNSLASTVASGGSGCPVCSGKTVLRGFNDLASARPVVASMWDFEKNTVTPGEVTSMSGRNAHWICGEGHSWEALIYNVTDRKGCPVCSSHRLLPGFNDLATLNPTGMDTWDYERNAKTPSEYFGYSNSSIYRICEKKHSWTSLVSDIGRTGCPKCIHRVSSYEDEIHDFIVQYTPVVRNSRSIVPPKEIDLFLPEFDLCIEVNGVYYHSSKFKDPRSDRDKRDLVLGIGSNFLAIWEDDWLYRKEIVKAHLLTRMGMVDGKVYARSTQVGVVSYEESSRFLENNHIQGKARGTHYVGLRTASGEIVACMVLISRSDGSLEVSRYATSTNVPGGHSKLIRFVERTYEYTYLVTFADLQLSTGNLYKRTGWVLDKELPQDYRYLVGLRRVHKFNYRKKRFQEDPNLKYDSTMTESELAVLNNLYRVYDYGKLRFVKPHPIRKETK